MQTNWKNAIVKFSPPPKHEKRVAWLGNGRSRISKRKGEQIRICLQKDVQFHKKQWF